MPITNKETEQNEQICNRCEFYKNNKCIKNQIEELKKDNECSKFIIKKELIFFNRN